MAGFLTTLKQQFNQATYANDSTGIPDQPMKLPPATMRERPSAVPESWVLSLQIGWALVVAAGASIVAIIGGSAVHSHYALKNALCNTLGGQYAQQQSDSTAAHCGWNGFMSGISGFAHWAGIVGLIGVVVVGVLLLVARSATASGTDA